MSEDYHPDLLDGGSAAAVPISPDRIAEMRQTWATGDPAAKEAIFEELAQVLAGTAKDVIEARAHGREGSPSSRAQDDLTDAELRQLARDDDKCRRYPLTDIGNSQRFAHRKRPVARYCHAYRAWFIWDGERWAKDLRGKSVELAKSVVLRIGQEAITMSNSGSESSSIFRWAATSQARPRIDAALYLAQSTLAIGPDDLDARPYLLNLPNGTLNLLTGKLGPHQKDDFLTKMAGVEYNPLATCPRWIEHLNLIFNGDHELIDAFQQLLGYTLLQDNPEQVLFILYGAGKNGKSKTIEVLSHILGEYAINIAAETLMSKRFDTGPRSDIARIANARLVSASEGESGARLAESLVKALTGGDIVTVRRLYENEFQFRPTAKIWYATNHRPVIMGTDDAIWRRIWLIPFTVAIPEDKRDPDIATKLLQEGSGILNWALDGLRKYRDAGHLIQPEKVRVATDEYRQDSDVLKEFLEGWCVLKGEIKRSDLYRNYVDWCDQNHEKPVSSKKFAAMVRERGIKEKTDAAGNRCWDGLSPRGYWK